MSCIPFQARDKKTSQELLIRFLWVSYWSQPYRMTPPTPVAGNQEGAGRDPGTHLLLGWSLLRDPRSSEAYRWQSGSWQTFAR